MNDVGLILVYVLVLWVPGLVTLLSAGSRGWVAWAVAPLATYGIAGIVGPVSSGLGLPWNPATLAVGAALAAGAGFAVLVATRGWAETTGRFRSEWERAQHVTVAVVVALSAAIGAAAVLGGLRRLSTIPQDWDAAFHANGIAWIARTGDGGLSGMTRLIWYGSAPPQYYPNSYHLVGAVVTDLTGRDIPSILNANTVLMPGVLALGIAVLCQRLGGSALLAAASSLAAVGVSAFYDMLWRGPVLPFAMGVALVPALLVVLLEFLAAPRLPRRLPTLVPLALAAAGMYALHPGAFVAAALFALALIASLWITAPRRIPVDLASLGIAAVVAVAALLPHLLGSLRSATEASVDWPAVTTPAEAFGQALLFGHASESLQVWFALLLFVGLLTWWRLGSLRWMIVPAALFVGLFVAATASDAPLVEAVTRPWWNDRFRLIGIAVIPLAVFVGHGAAQISEAAGASVTRLMPATRSRRFALPVQVGAAGLVAGVLLTVTGVSYLGRNEALMAKNTGEGPAVSSAEAEGFRVLGQLVRPGDRVLNDKGDGSVWMYALGGAVPVAGHYNQALVDPDVRLLAQRFDDYDRDPAVRTAVDRLEVRWVVLGRGFLRSNATREAGLDELNRVAGLRIAYQNPDFVIYRLSAPGSV